MKCVKAGNDACSFCSSSMQRDRCQRPDKLESTCTIICITYIYVCNTQKLRNRSQSMSQPSRGRRPALLLCNWRSIQRRLLSMFFMVIFMVSVLL